MTHSQPAWQREPEFSPQLPRLQMWPFPNAWGALKHLLLLISAPLLSAHQQLSNLHLILLCVLAFQVFVEEGGDTSELGRGGSLFSELCSYTWVVVSREPFKQEYQKHPEGACCFHMSILSLDSVSYGTLTAASAKLGLLSSLLPYFLKNAKYRECSDMGNFLRRHWPRRYLRVLVTWKGSAGQRFFSSHQHLNN